MEKEPTISICIPTYNQPNSIRTFFDSAKDQLTDNIEVIIRDDSPNDETGRIVKEWDGKLKCPVRYFKGEKSKIGGYDKALLFLTEEAKGRYLWWFGDDILVSDAVVRVVSLIKEKNPDFIWINSRNIDVESDKGFDLGGDKIFKSGSEIFSTNVGLLGFPSATILNREKAIKNIQGAKKFIGTTLTGFYLVLSVISENGKMYFIQEPCLLSYPKPLGEVRWYDSFVVHGVNYHIIAREFKNKFEKAAFRKGLADQFGRIWRAVVVERAMGFKTGFGAPTHKIWKMTKLYWNYPEFWIALPLFLTPRFILRIFYKIYKFFKQRPHRLLFRKFFPHKTEVDFPAGYIPNRFFLSRIDKGPVLVVGDYMGRDYSAIKEKIKETYLIDVIDNNIVNNKFFIQQSITELIKFPDNYFQYVVIAEVIEHIWEDKNALKEIYRVLSPEGKLLMSAPLFHDFADHHYHIYSPRTISILLKHSGFSITEAQYKGLAVAVPNGIVALIALLLFPVFGGKALLKVNKFFYYLHLLTGKQKRINSIFRFKYPFLRGYGVLIEAVKSDEVIDSIQVQKDSFQL